jgi:hypothetical protein
MWQVSDDFSAQLETSSRRWRTRLEVLYLNEVVESLDVLVQGYVSIDNVAVRREAHFTLVDADGTLTPAKATDLLAPKGTEIRVFRGLYLPALNDYEWVPMGVFGIISPATRANEAGTQIEIKAFDRLDKLRALQFETAYTVPDGTNVATAVAGIMNDRMPGVPIRITPSTYTTPETVFAQLSSPWDAISALCQAASMVFYFDQNGSAVVEPYTEVETGVVYDSGSPTSLLMSSEQAWDNTDINTGVIVKGANPDKTVFSTVLWDTDPNSPTYYLGPLGKRPYGYYSEFITTQAQADAVAANLFISATRMPQTVEIYTRGGPQHDVGDLITIVDSRTKVNGKYVVKSGTIPIINTQGDHVRLACVRAGHMGAYPTNSI